VRRPRCPAPNTITTTPATKANTTPTRVIVENDESSRLISEVAAGGLFGFDGELADVLVGGSSLGPVDGPTGMEIGLVFGVVALDVPPDEEEVGPPGLLEDGGGLVGGGVVWCDPPSRSPTTVLSVFAVLLTVLSTVTTRPFTVLFSVVVRLPSNRLRMFSELVLVAATVVVFVFVLFVDELEPVAA
jgi:hypothetical protein